MLALSAGEHPRERNDGHRHVFGTVETGAIALETDNATPRAWTGSSMRGTGHFTLRSETTAHV
jgi:hypothetical protein